MGGAVFFDQPAYKFRPRRVDVAEQCHPWRRQNKGDPSKTLQNRHFAVGTPIAISLNVNIRFVSTLTPEDENAMAPAVIKAVAAILDLLPIAYVLRIDTTDAQVYQHIRQDDEPSGLAADASAQVARSAAGVRMFDS
jgi:hypothetical protein